MPPTAAPLRWYPSGARPTTGPTLLWLHGGGFFRGGLDQPEAHDVARALARRGLAVVTVHYRLAPPPGLPWVGARGGRPRGRFPLALDDVLGAYHQVSARTSGGVLLGGASAGACLAAGATLRALDEGARPAGAVFAYGFFHAAHPRVPDAGRRSRGHRRLTHAPWALDAANRNYAGSRRALSDRLAFPGGHDLDGFPRTLVVDAEHDDMSASGGRFAAELAASGAAVEHHVLPGTNHAFLNRPRLDAFDVAVSLIADWACAPYSI